MISIAEFDRYNRYFRDNRKLPTLAVEDLLQTAEHGLGLRQALLDFLPEAKRECGTDYLATLLNKLEAALANADNYVNNMRRAQNAPTARTGAGHNG